MEYGIVEKKVHCPYCAEPISILLDLSVSRQSYVEDCQVCCQAMQIDYETEDGHCVSVQVECA